MKTCEVVSVGTELLMGLIADTNAQEVGRMLPELGIAHFHRQTVGDNLDRLAEALRLALSRSDIVITIGGLGPTQEDLTRQGIAAALGVELIPNARIEEHLRKLFEFRKIPWTETQLRQALVPENGEPIENPNGTAPGLLCRSGDKAVFALPGPRGEFVPMLRGPVREYLKIHFAEGVLVTRLLRIVGMGESMVEEALHDLMDNPNPTVAPYAKLGEIHLRLSAHAADAVAAHKLIDPIELEIRSRLGRAIFGEGDLDLESAIVAFLKQRNQTVATAESITGGQIAERLTAVPGASGPVRGGVVVYQVEMKKTLLGVDAKGDPVSEEVAQSLAVAAREKLKADYGIGITGNAGPTSDEGGKPVGLTYIGLATPEGCKVHRYQFQGTREDIRRRASQAALTMLYQALVQD